MKLFISGVAGFIGGHIAERALEQGYSVVGCDTFEELVYPSVDRQYFIASLNQRFPQFSFMQGSQINVAQPALLSGVDAYINSAALPNQNLSWTHQDRYFQTNAEDLSIVAQRCMSIGIPHLLHLSSSSIYGDGENVNETAPSHPHSPYGQSKLEGETALLTLFGTSGLFTILRLFSVYGPRQRNDMGISRLISAIHDGLEYPIYNQAQQVRTFTFVEDVVDSVFAALSQRPRGEIFNISGQELMRYSDVISLCETLLNKRAKVVEYPARPGEQSEISGDIRKAMNLLGYSPKVSFETGLIAQVRSMYSGVDIHGR